MATGTMFDALERIEGKVDRVDRVANRTRRQAKKAKRRASLNLYIVVAIIILFLILLAWFAWAVGEAAERIPGPIRGLFGISGDIPAVTHEAYHNAAAQMPAECGMTWQILAGIGKIESSHGTYGGAQPDATGVVEPAIRGIVLDGTVDGTAVVYDSDGGELDGDSSYDRAVGPAQALPSTWASVMPAGTDPQNVNDSSLFTARLLCSYGDLSDSAVLAQAVYGYNHSDDYVADVLQWKAFYDQQPTVPVAGEPAKQWTPWDVMRDSAWAKWQTLGRGPLQRLDPTMRYVVGPSDKVDPKPSRGGGQGATAQGQRIADVALRRVGTDFNPGVAAQCAYFVRDVLDEAGVNVGVTSQALDGDLNPGPVYEGEARSIGADQGRVITDPSMLAPGDIVQFTDTYGTVISGGNWARGSITHVGVYVGGGMIVDRSTSSAPVKHRPLGTFEHFAGAIRLTENTRTV